MNRQAVIRKTKSSLYIAVSAAAVFTALAVMFAVFAENTGGIRSVPFWLFAAAACGGWFMIIDYIKAYMVISDEGILSRSISGRDVFVPMSEIRTIGTNGSFFFVYGDKNRILASMEADLNTYEEACAILKDHGVEIADRNFRNKNKNTHR